jgi:hypothetical protein
MLSDVQPPENFDVVVGTDRPIDPIGAISEAEQALGEAAEAGATICTPTLLSRSLQHHLEQLDALVL